MELKELGNTGVRIPEIGIGVWRYSGGVEPLRRGIELGAFLIDTAEIYGTEEAVAEAIRASVIESSSPPKCGLSIFDTMTCCALPSRMCVFQQSR